MAGSMPATAPLAARLFQPDRKSTRLNSSHLVISYAVFCLKKKKLNPRCDSPAPPEPRAATRAGAPRRALLFSRPARNCDRRPVVLAFFFFFFFFNDTATTEIYTLSLHDALPIFPDGLPFDIPGPDQPPPSK